MAESDLNIRVDMDNDNDLDTEIGYADGIGKLAWYEQPDNYPEQLWSEHIVADATQRINSVGVADVDGDLDISMGEQRNQDPGGLRMLLFENGGNDNWISHEVYAGDEHHDSGLLVDLDQDSDFDIIPIGWTHLNLLIYENQAP